MTNEDILKALRKLKIETGSIACLGCGYEHSCSVHGCRIMREAAGLIEKLTDRCTRYAEEITVLQEQEKTRGKAEKEGRVIVMPCKVGDTAYWVHSTVITECRVHRIQMNRNGLYICLKSTMSHGAFRVDLCLGKSVFFTREEAEAALEARSND